MYHGGFSYIRKYVRSLFIKLFLTVKSEILKLQMNCEIVDISSIFEIESRKISVLLFQGFHENLFKSPFITEVSFCSSEKTYVKSTFLDLIRHFRSVISSSIATIDDLDTLGPCDSYGIQGSTGFPALLPLEHIKLKDESIKETTTLKIPEKRKAVTLGRAHTAPFLKKAQQILGELII